MTANPQGLPTVDELHALVTESTGLTDFGGDEYLEGLRVLLHSLDTEAGLTPLGRAVATGMLQGALSARALSEAGWTKHPEYADIPIQRPIFVTGLMRTGTTALHRLLVADPAHQGLELWLTELPQPRPPRDTWDSDPGFRRIDAVIRAQNAANPDLMGTHYNDAAEVEECWRLLQQSMMSVAFESLLYVPGYSAWLDKQDWTPAYRRHRRNLQLIGLNEPEKRWILKNPSHLFGLDAIMAAYPDALIIQTHRASRTAIVASGCSLTEQHSRGWSDVFDPHTIGRTQLDCWARGLDRFVTQRARYDPAQFLDVHYEDLVADPVGTVENVYAHFGIALTDEARDAVRAADAQSKEGDRAPSHRYRLEDFGLTEADIEERFSRG